MKVNRKKEEQESRNIGEGGKVRRERHGIKGGKEVTEKETGRQN